MDLITYALAKNGSGSSFSGDYNDLRNKPIIPTPGDYVTAGQKAGTTLGERATAEGLNTTASAAEAHAEGTTTEATGPFSHAEGADTKATNSAAHAEGRYTEATQTAAHAEGDYSVAKAIYSHAEGTHTKAYGVQSHAEGHYNIALGDSAHAEGYSEDRVGNFFITKSITPGWYTVSNWPENEELYSKYNIVYIMYNNTQYYGYIDQVDVEGLSLHIYLPNFSHWSDLPTEAIKLYVIKVLKGISIIC